MCYFQSCILNCPSYEPTMLRFMGVFHLSVHVVSLNPLTFEDNLYLGHTEVCVSVGVVWAYSEGLPLMEIRIVMETTALIIGWLQCCKGFKPESSFFDSQCVFKWSKSTSWLHNYLSRISSWSHMLQSVCLGRCVLLRAWLTRLVRSPAFPLC